MTDRDTDQDILDEVQQLIQELESHPDPAIRDKVTRLLQGIDAVHRTALTHLVAAIQGMAGEAFLNRLVSDPAIRLLFMSYGLVAVTRRLQAEEALDAIRGPLHDRGIDIELIDVVGGVVYAKFHGLKPSGPTEDEVADQVEAALKDGFLGFQELVTRDPRERAAPVIPLMALKANKPVYRTAWPADDLLPGTMRALELEERPILLVNIDGDVHALADRCGDSPLPLHFGTLDGDEVRCPWHGCRYDVRTGRRRDVEAPGVAVYPVAIENGEIRIAVGVEPVGRS